jgi:site-specific DNA-methyltransferase (adenine-specific)
VPTPYSTTDDRSTLFYGDNLAILRDHIPTESVDLIYLDPPFKSNQDYNVLFAEQDGSRSSAQIKAFEDTWHWDQAAARSFEDTVETGGKAAQALIALRQFIGGSDMLAYLSIMTPRLIELRRVLKPTGSIYLHCDPTASHYLKIVMDAIFNPQNFHADIRWKRTSAHGNVLSNYALVSDQLLFYTRGKIWKWNQAYQSYDAEYIESHYGQRDEKGRRFTTRDLTASMQRASSGQLYAWKGVKPVATRCWSYTKDKMEQFEAQGLLVYGRSGVPRLKLYLEEQPGTPLTDTWTDIPPINSQAAERLGYPTQKPEALLERIIKVSSNEADVVLDPFCGCGTVIAAAQRLNRRWIGIDITHLAVGLIKHRLLNAFDLVESKHYRVIGEPEDVPSAMELAERDPYQFQSWALGKVGARQGGEIKKGADHGIDGRLFFHDERGGKTRQIIFSVKSGNLKMDYLRALRGVIEREKAEIGVFISMKPFSGPMRAEAAKAGFYHSTWGTTHPRLQLLTIEEILDGERIDYPPSRANITFKRAPKAAHEPENQTLPFI